MKTLLFLLIPVTFLNFVKCESGCSSLIFCQGELLRIVQTSGLFRDSKTFVDMSLVRSAETTLKHFDHFMAVTRRRPTRDEVAEFVEQHFQASNNELENWTPPDYQPNPPFLRRIKDYKMRLFAKHLLDIWPQLGRRLRREVLMNSAKYSIIQIPNGFIVPGGRFREFYYWDSYWIIRGLMICEMRQTAKGMVDNFFKVVETYGFIPNGGRIYYLDRSQPPMLTMMVEEVMLRTNDLPWLKKNLDLVEREINYWLKTKVISVEKDGRMYTLARYMSESDTPRPESYIEDFVTAAAFQSNWQKKHCYMSIRTGAETGWDFSTRWFINQKGENKGIMTNVNPSRLIPVDLNAFLCKSIKILGNFYKKLRNRYKSKLYLKKAQEWEVAIEAILYDEEDGIWYDFDVDNMRPRKYFYPSNFAPLWTESYNHRSRHKYGINATNYVIKTGILEFEGGIPTSLTESGQQWDFPNAWAPLQTMVIFGLEKTEVPEAQAIAKKFALKWLSSLYRVVNETHEMFEKYNARFAGVYGGGGEYEVQTGFGWTNGAVLELIEFYYMSKKGGLQEKLKEEVKKEESPPPAQDVEEESELT